MSLQRLITMITKKNYDLVVLFFWALALSDAFASQQFNGSIQGQITQEGSPLPGVSVTIEGPGGIKTATTGVNGEYQFFGISPGQYTVTASLEGFAQKTIPNVQVGVGQSVTVNVDLTGGPVPIPDSGPVRIPDPSPSGQAPSQTQEDSPSFKCEKKSFSTKQQLLNWLQQNSQSNMNLIAVVPLGDKTSIFIFDTTVPPAGEYNVFQLNESLSEGVIQKQINTRVGLEFLGIHRISRQTFLMVMTDE